MSRQRSFLLPALLPAILFLTGCQERADPESAQAEAAPLSIYVVNYPLQYFAERIGGSSVTVHFPAPGDGDPAEWEPDDETILQYQQADIILLNGAGYANWVEQVSLPEGATVNTSRNIRDRFLEVEDAITHSHGPHGTHTHAGTAFTTWLDPLLATEQARVVKEVLTERIPAGREDFEQRFQALASDLAALDRRLEEIVGRERDKPLLASHPVYQYLEARYRLNLSSLHWEPDEMPGDSEWYELDRLLENHPATWILWEDEPLSEIAEGLLERGVSSLVYNPGSLPPEEGDWLALMRQNAENLRRAFASPEEE